MFISDKNCHIICVSQNISTHGNYLLLTIIYLLVQLIKVNLSLCVKIVVLHNFFFFFGLVFFFKPVGARIPTKYFNYRRQRVICIFVHFQAGVLARSVLVQRNAIVKSHVSTKL